MTTARPADPPSPETVRARLRALIDPEIGLNVVDLGLVHTIAVNPAGAVRVELLVTAPGCPLKDTLCDGATRLVSSLPGVTAADVCIVDEPAWHPGRIAPGALD